MPVLLKIHVKNESSKYFFSMDKKCYTCYSQEKEILLLQGLKAEVKAVTDKSIAGRQMKEIELEISEKMQARDKCIKLSIFIPLFLIWQLTIIYVPFGFFQKDFEKSYLLSVFGLLVFMLMVTIFMFRQKSIFLAFVVLILGYIGM